MDQLAKQKTYIETFEGKLEEERDKIPSKAKTNPGFRIESDTKIPILGVDRNSILDPTSIFLYSIGYF